MSSVKMNDVMGQSTQELKEAGNTWWLYLIETATGSLYCGITKDVARRLREHESDPKRGARALRGKGPLTLRFKAISGTHSQALQSEYRVKKLSRDKKLELIKGDQDLLQLLGLLIFV